MQILGLVLAVIIGVVLGLIGGGGSILTVPLVNYFFDTTMLLATTYSLIVVTISSFFGFTQRIFSKEVNYKLGAQFVVPSMIVAFSIRYWIMPLFPIKFNYGTVELSRDLIITTLLVGVMLYTSIQMFRHKDSNSSDTANHKLIVILFYGVVTGLLSGFIGAGGGFIIVPILLKLSLDLRTAVGTSMFIITIQSIIALIGDFYNPEIQAIGIDWSLVALLSALTIVGVFIGTKLQRKISSTWLRTIFALILLLVAVGMIIKLLNN